jgi:hypothetical protein
MIVPILSANHALSLPECSGVYAICNTNSGAVYIGMARNIRRRYRNWHKAMTNRKEISIFMEEAIIVGPLDAWQFEVLHASGTATDSELYSWEGNAIRCAVKAGMWVLNAKPMRKARHLLGASMRTRPKPPEADSSTLNLDMGFDLPDAP